MVVRGEPVHTLMVSADLFGKWEVRVREGKW